MTLSDSTGTAACSSPHVRQPTAPEARPLAPNSARWALEEGPRRLGAEDSALVLAESRIFFPFLRPSTIQVACRCRLPVCCLRRDLLVMGVFRICQGCIIVCALISDHL